MKSIKASLITIFSTFVCFLATDRAAIAQSDKPAEQAFNNIQVLKGMPASQLMPVMHFMRTSLGVRCDYCHVAENGKYQLDDKPAKQTARRMIQMVFDLNREKFGGMMVITCNTCHQGRARPVSVPGVGQGVFTNTTREDPDVKQPDPLPTPDQIFDHYVQALGGKSAIDKIATRISKVSLLRPKLVGGGTPNAHMIARGETWSLETYYKAPNKYLAITTTPEGVVYQGFNGATGWIKSANNQREMNPAELARIKKQADLYKDINLQKEYSKVTVIGKEKINDREVFTIEALNANNKIEKLFFDAQTGLLVRRVVFTETVLGLDPEQTDYEDYKDIDGVKLALTVKISYLDDSHLGTTRKISDVKQNVPVDDSKFDMPAKR